MIVAKNVEKVLGTPPNRIIQGVSLEIQDGEFVALTGRSGSGKSTLLYILSSLDPPSSGSVEIDGMELMKSSPAQLDSFRNQKIGFVFQFHYLLAELTAMENVLFPKRKQGIRPEHREYGESLLQDFGLSEKMHRLPRQLSGGEQQRVAIARALLSQPKYLFADEPTGSLDSASGETVMRIIRESNEKRGTTVVMVTHDPDFAGLAKRQIQLMDGRVIAGA